MIARLRVLLLLSVLGAGVSTWHHGLPRQPSAEPAEVLIQALLQDRPLIVDARRRSAALRRPIPEAVPVDPLQAQAALMNVLEHWDGQRSLLVVCNGPPCPMADELAEYLRQQLPEAKVQAWPGTAQNLLRALASRSP